MMRAEFVQLPSTLPKPEATDANCLRCNTEDDKQVPYGRRGGMSEACTMLAWVTVVLSASLIRKKKARYCCQGGRNQASRWGEWAAVLRSVPVTSQPPTHQTLLERPDVSRCFSGVENLCYENVHTLGELEARSMLLKRKSRNCAEQPHATSEGHDLRECSHVRLGITVGIHANEHA